MIRGKPSYDLSTSTKAELFDERKGYISQSASQVFKIK